MPQSNDLLPEELEWLAKHAEIGVIVCHDHQHYAGYKEAGVTAYVNGQQRHGHSGSMFHYYLNKGNAAGLFLVWDSTPVHDEYALFFKSEAEADKILSSVPQELSAYSVQGVLA